MIMKAHNSTNIKDAAHGQRGIRLHFACFKLAHIVSSTNNSMNKQAHHYTVGNLAFINLKEIKTSGFWGFGV